jgi:hypothetical protein
VELIGMEKQEIEREREGESIKRERDRRDRERGDKGTWKRV